CASVRRITAAFPVVSEVAKKPLRPSERSSLPRVYVPSIFLPSYSAQSCIRYAPCPRNHSRRQWARRPEGVPLQRRQFCLFQFGRGSGRFGTFCTVERGKS